MFTKYQFTRLLRKKPNLKSLCVIAKKLFSSALSWIIVLITVGGFLFTIHPRISIEPGESLDPLQPFKTSFIIKNDGYWRLVDIDYSLTIDKMKTINNDRLENVGFGGLSEKIDKLGANESSTIL